MSEYKRPLLLKRLDLDDAEEYYDLFDKNRKHIAEHDKNLAEAFRTISEVREHFSPRFKNSRKHYGIITQGLDGGMVGATALSFTRDRGAEIAYWIDEDHIKQGLATAACRMMIRHVHQLTPARNIDAIIASTNEASIRVVTKLGFKRSLIREDDEIYSLNISDKSQLESSN